MKIVYGFFRDANYYLFKVGGWKWLITIAVLINLVRCGVEIEDVTIAPNCSYHSTEIDLLNGITTNKVCKQSKEEEKLLCELLHADLGQKKLKNPLIQQIVQTVEDPAILFMAELRLSNEEFFNSLTTAETVMAKD